MDTYAAKQQNLLGSQQYAVELPTGASRCGVESLVEDSTGMQTWATHLGAQFGIDLKIFTSADVIHISDLLLLEMATVLFLCLKPPAGEVGETHFMIDETWDI